MKLKQLYRIKHVIAIIIAAKKIRKRKGWILQITEKVKSSLIAKTFT